MMKKRWFNYSRQRDKSAEDQRLGLLAKELGVAVLMVLVNDYDFSQEAANEALGKVLEQAKTNRLLITTTVVGAAYDDLNNRINDDR
jgi:hypothetical protein